MMSKAVRVDAAGGPEILRVSEIELGEPGEGEVLLRHMVIGANMIDTYHRAAESGQYAIERPAVLGVEAVGVVEALGSGVTDVKVGERVAYWNFIGAYAEHRVMPAWRLVPVPDDVSDEVAAASVLKGATASYLLQRVCRVEAGQTILVHAAAGGVGQLLTRWASRLGVTVIGTVGSPEKVEIARQAGCASVILYREQDFRDSVREMTGGTGVDIVLDSVGRETFEKSLDCLKPLGLMVNYGQASGPVEPLDVSILAKKGSIFLAKPTLATFTKTREDLLDLATGVFKALSSGDLKVEIGLRAPLADAAEVHRKMEARATVGSVLLVP